VVLDTAVAQLLAGELDIPATMAQIEAGWNDITDTKGRDAQREAYAASLGVER
jgi:multiple sugar transport system substrate-binding protein